MRGSLIGDQVGLAWSAETKAKARAKAHATAAATARLHELRDADGRWVHDNAALTAAATGIRASGLRLHDHVLSADTVPTPGRMGLAVDLRPSEIVAIRHRTDHPGRGRKPVRHTIITTRHPETGVEREEDLKDGTSVKVFKREDVHAALRGGPQPARPPARPRPAPPPVVAPPAPPAPAPAPSWPTSESVLHPSHAGHFGIASLVSSDMIPDPGQRAAAKAEVQHALDEQGKFVPKIAGRTIVSLTDNLGGGLPAGAIGQTLYGGQVMLSIRGTRAVGNASHIGPRGETPDELLKRDQERKWWVPSDPQHSLADTTVAHEEGHVVAEHVSHKAMFSRDLWEPIARALGLPVPGTFNDAITRKPELDLPGWIAANKARIMEAVSEYGTTNLFELQAELWSEYTMSSRPRPAARIYGDYVTAQLRAKEGL